jgi:hypothetical protein
MLGHLPISILYLSIRLSTYRGRGLSGLRLLFCGERLTRGLGDEAGGSSWGASQRKRPHAEARGYGGLGQGRGKRLTWRRGGTEIQGQGRGSSPRRELGEEAGEETGGSDRGASQRDRSGDKPEGSAWGAGAGDRPHAKDWGVMWSLALPNSNAIRQSRMAPQQQAIPGAITTSGGCQAIPPTEHPQTAQVRKVAHRVAPSRTATEGELPDRPRLYCTSPGD